MPLRVKTVLRAAAPGPAFGRPRRTVLSQGPARAVSIGRDDLLAGERAGRERQE